MESGSKLRIPLSGESVPAGFPSPADDFVDKSIDLNKELVKHPHATFFVRVAGDSMINANIFEGDVLVVDRALEAKNGDIVIAVVFGEFTLKRLILKDDKIVLKSENPNYKDIEISPETDFLIWGVVTSVIRQLKR